MTLLILAALNITFLGLFAVVFLSITVYDYFYDKTDSPFIGLCLALFTAVNGVGALAYVIQFLDGYLT